MSKQEMIAVSLVVLGILILAIITMFAGINNTPDELECEIVSGYIPTTSPSILPDLIQAWIDKDYKDCLRKTKP